GRNTNPTLYCGNAVSCSPVAMKPMVPDRAIGKPIAAAVPIAVSNGTLHQSMKGTVRNAPPTAANADSALIVNPASDIPASPGGRREGFGLRSRRMLVPARQMTAAKSAANTAVETIPVIQDPMTPPTSTPGAIFQATSQRIAPRFA